MIDVDALLAGMTAAQLAGWAAFAELEPFGPLRDDQRAAVAACVVANSIPFRGRGAKSIRPGDVLASLAPPAKTHTTTDLADVAKGLNARFGGEVRTLPKGDAQHGRQKRRPRNRHRG